MAGGFMTGLATGFLNAKSSQMEKERDTEAKIAAESRANKVKLAATLAEESRASQRKLRDRLAAGQQDREQNLAYIQKTYGVSPQAAALIAELPPKDKADYVYAASERAMRAGSITDVPSRTPVSEESSTEGLIGEVQKTMVDSRGFPTRPLQDMASGYKYKSAEDVIMAAVGAPFGAIYMDGQLAPSPEGTTDAGALAFIASETKRLGDELQRRVTGGEDEAKVVRELRARATMESLALYEEHLKRKAAQGTGDGDIGAEGKVGTPQNPLSIMTDEDAKRAWDIIKQLPEEERLSIVVTRPNGKPFTLSNEDRVEKLRKHVESLRGTTPPPAMRNPREYRNQ